MSAQVLARPGWAGSGVAPEAWWPRAVFYRIDPTRFQDSDGDGTGDLQGIADRLDYLQSLGIDAIILDGLPDARQPGDLGDLTREASQRHLRVLLTVTPALLQGGQAVLLSTVHDWLGAGAAGIWMPRPGNGVSAAFTAALTGVRPLLSSFPGNRLLLTDAASALSAEPARAPARERRRGSAESTPAGSVLLTAAVFPVHRGSPDQLHGSLVAASEDTGSNPHPLLRFAEDPATGSPDAAADGTLLLASRGAVILDFGAEIGLQLFPGTASDAEQAGSLPVMQWTPSNRTPAAMTGGEAASAAAPAGPVYGAYHPYQPPPRNLTSGMQSTVRVAEDANLPPAPPAPDMLPGFSAADRGEPVSGSAERNVIVEDRDPSSLLNQYRQLIALHHDNATLRNGSAYVLPQTTPGTLLWVRRAPAGSRTVANVLAAVNLTPSAVVIDLDASLGSTGMRPGAVRTLFSSVPAGTTGESTGHLTLPPHAALLGEIYHAGLIEPGAESRRERGGHRRSGHRVRR